jgi:hypothetical protein
VEDLRDIRGRLVRLVVATLVGVPGAFAIAYAIDWLVHDYHPFRDFELPLLVAGAIVCTFGCYVVLQALAHRRPRLPRARLVVR